MASCKLTLLMCLMFCAVSTVYMLPKNPIPLKDFLFAKKYLKEFHYLSPVSAGNHDWRTAVELFQRYMKLPVTGQIDKYSIATMHKPRCGFPDIEEDEDTKSPSGKTKRFAVAPVHWNKTSLTYGFITYSGDMTVAKQQTILANAFKMWSDNSPLTFTFESTASLADIKISFGTGRHGSCIYPFDGPGQILGHAFYPTDGSLHLDDDEDFTDGQASGTNLLAVAVHEIGHVLGIAHSSESSAVMFPTYTGYDPNIPLALHEDDINAVAYRYGGGTATPEATVLPASCVDQLATCSNYQYMCSSGDPGMLTICPSTCGTCQQAQTSCKDTLDTKYCQGYLALKLCQYPQIMDQCEKTCGKCT